MPPISGSSPGSLFKKAFPHRRTAREYRFLLKHTKTEYDENNCRDKLNIQQKLKKNQKDEKRKKEIK